MTALFTGPLSALAPGVTPVYPRPPHCNTVGLTNLGAYVVRRMIAKHMIIEIDHMSARVEDEALSIAEAQGYPASSRPTAGMRSRSMGGSTHWAGW